MLLGDLFDLSLKGRRDVPAVDVDSDAGGRTLTFGEVDDRAAGMAAALTARGVSPGDRMAVQLPNGLPFLDLFLACVRLGVVFVPINVLYREREIVSLPTVRLPRGTKPQLARPSMTH